ncbi:heterokaryon incompatibility protein [Colletotrichum kahawae]|uniref:Heterokaryon incompatibility protein n=1 Tax=Colletotrichum kahawae TaxID=34407 RepID=A0AAD9Y5A1_COLKA|nr:heterokaryon incompatibility protein [Colletotrichum kahawae]
MHQQEQRSPKRSSSAGRSVATSPSLPTSAKSLPSSTTGTLGDKVYRYNALGESEIRLIRLLPARMFKIKCEVVHAPITNPPTYIAVSYAWGDAGDTRRLELEGTEIPVSASLHGALQALRRKNEVVTVWVDALCIDQYNRDERTQQVQMMTKIYSTADSVAVWLGPEADRSSEATDFLLRLTQQSGSPDKITKLLSSKSNEKDISAIVSLFERDYWKRLWVVQEVFNARSVTVYCGPRKLPWDVYREASHVFQRHKGDLDYYFPGNSQGRSYARASQNHFTYSQILTYQGPGSLPDVRAMRHYGEDSLLEVMRVCRRRFSSDPKDKVFGILGLLTEDVRKDFPVDYSLSVKEIYTNVVDFLISTTGRFDVICEAIHYPPHMNTASLPSWVPDWSHIPDTVALGAMDFEPPFSASQRKEIKFSWKDDRRNKIEVTCLEIDTILTHGIAVGTLCTLADYLMAFIHWRALLLSTYKADDLEAQDLFCRALCLNQVPRKWANSFDWVTACFHVFASLIRERLPHLPLDQELEKYIDTKTDIKPDARRRFLQEHFGSRMMGRCFYITEKGRIGIGSGFMAVGDIVVVPLGCSTPVILRPEGCRSECRYVGDAYLHGYMYGKAIDQWRNGDRKASKFVLH